MLDGSGGLVQFALTTEEELANEKFKQPGFMGHPKGLEWFCALHIEQARALRHLTQAEALQQLLHDPAPDEQQPAVQPTAPQHSARDTDDTPPEGGAATAGVPESPLK
jgi:hypothetical protein